MKIFSDHYPILMNWQANVDVDIKENYLPFRDISFMKNQKQLSNYLTDLRLEPEESMSLF